MAIPEYEVVTIAEQPDLVDKIDTVASNAWPEFMLHDAVADQYWGKMLTRFPEFTFALRVRGSDAFMAMGNSIPIVWTEPFANLPDRGWDWALEHGCTAADARETPTTLCAIQIAVAADYQGQGVSTHAVRAMREIAAQHGLGALVAPVRPNMKARYPLTPMTRYIRWRRADGLPFDAWLRVHARLGATIVKVCGRAMHISGTIAEWEAWTGMAFPETGDYIIPGALNSVHMDLEQDQGTYVEPNVWMHHQLP